YSSVCQEMAIPGAASTVKFCLAEHLLRKHLETVGNGEENLEPGDLFLFKLFSPSVGWCGAHVDMYCGNREISHLAGKWEIRDISGHKSHACVTLLPGGASSNKGQVQHLGLAFQ
uniref:Uncharacterized protein n=1 Tax=Chelonoidis abingdonii TaxID=106734 RepID=A0A8C0QR75_CHEAB